MGRNTVNKRYSAASKRRKPSTSKSRKNPPKPKLKVRPSRIGGKMGVKATLKF